MIFPNEIPVRFDSKHITTNRQYPAATTALEKSCFYNKSLCQAFKEKFSFEYPIKKED